METEMIKFGKPVIGEPEHKAVQDVLEGDTLTHGPRVKEFEAAFAEFTGAPHAIATASCMASLHLAYMAIDLGPGDEVIVPAQTHVAMAHAVAACGATPVFCDCEAETGNIDLDQAAALVTDKTRAISVVHYLGLPVDMDRVKEIAASRSLFVVEDCAIALGARIDGTHVGLLGDIGCFSFYPVKHITTGEGGMVITTREDIAERVSKQRAFGIDKSFVAERRHSGAYDVEFLGMNYRLGEIGAALGIEQMKRLPGFLEVRARNYRALFDGLSGVEGLDLVSSDDRGPFAASHYCLVARLNSPLDEQREQVVEGLKTRGVGASVYYPKPLPDTSYYAALGQAGDAYPEARRISYGSIALPVAPHVTEGDIDRIVDAVRETLAEIS
jgi:dTDP-4-amino-4,6-dideoxygalactose transaminase